MNIVHNHIALFKGENEETKNFSQRMVGKPFPSAWVQSKPGEADTVPLSVYEASVALVEAGLSVIPIEAYEGSKSPDSTRLPRPLDGFSGQAKSSWSIFTIRRAQADELRGWYECGGSYGLAVIGGTVSGGKYGLGLEVIDLDTADLIGPWVAAVEGRAPGLVNRLVRVSTPRPGLHVYYRCSHYGVSQKLALAAATDAHGHTALNSAGHPTRKTLIELKAEGGYCLIPPSPPRCHPTYRLYQYAPGSRSLLDVPTITPEERSVLLNAARSLNQWKEDAKPAAQKWQSVKKPGLSRPGDDFNARGRWEDILPEHGWTVCGRCGEETRWRRPDKYDGLSATTNYQGSDLLRVFSSNADPFEQDTSYTKFAAYALLNHDGNFQKAAAALGELGFGKQAGKRKALAAGRRS